VANSAPPSPAPLPAAPASSPAPGGWLTFVGYLLGGFGSFVVASLALGLLFDRLTIWASLAVYAVNFACFAGAAYLLGVRRPGLTWAEFGLRPFRQAWLWLALLVAVAFIPLRAAAALLAETLVGGGLGDLQPRMDLVAPDGPLGLNFLVTLLGAGLLVPFAEELYFRGLLHRWLRSRFSFWPRVVLSSGLFALGHIDSIGVVASSFFLGFICALAVERSRSLWLPVAIHAVNNSLDVVLVYVALFFQGGVR
jgi:membrane protease YdiL (CAAX protease family)